MRLRPSGRRRPADYELAAPWAATEATRPDTTIPQRAPRDAGLSSAELQDFRMRSWWETPVRQKHTVPGLLLMAICLMVAPDRTAARQTDQMVSTCEILLSEQWHALSQGNGNAANKVLGRARRQGCLEPPVASDLCHIPAGQEAVQDLNGNTELVNVARSQQRLLGCQV